jgi:voltage-gated potassium channel
MIRAGADGVVLPQFIGGMRMASEMVRPAAVTFLDKMLKGKEGALRVEDVTVDTNSQLVGRKLRECPFIGVEGLLLVALGKGERYMINPSKEETIEGGDVMVFIGQETEITAIRELAGQ